MQSPESPDERRITWSLMGVVVVFVLLMTAIVIWITASLIRQELGNTSEASPEKAGEFTTPFMAATPVHTATATFEEAAIATLPPPTSTQPAAQEKIVVVEATWTPVPRSRYVRFLYWKVKPNRIKPGECVQIHWETEYAVSLKFYRNDELILDDAPVATTVQDCPTQTEGYVVYRLVAWNAAEESNFVQLQVKIDKAE